MLFEHKKFDNVSNGV